jgi:hypothetical protein
MGDDQSHDPYNAGDAQHVAKREKSQKTRNLQKKAAFRKIMSDPEGRMWMWDLLEMCRIHVTSFSSDSLAMAFQEGMRNVGLILEAQIFQLSPELYLKMLTENGGYKTE